MRSKLLISGLALVVGLGVAVSGLDAQTTISRFTKLRITSNAADALVVSGTAIVNGQQRLENTGPVLTIAETDAAANSGKWRIVADGTLMAIQAMNDAESVTSSGLTFSRSGSSAALATFDVPVTVNGVIQTMNSTSPIVAMNETDAGSNAKYWRLVADGGQAAFQVLPDSLASALDVWSVTRSGSTPTAFRTAVPHHAADGSVSAPGYGFTSATNTGFYRTGGGQIGWGVGGVAGGVLQSNGVNIGGGALGTGTTNGGVVTIGRNSSGSGAAACLLLQDRTGSGMYLYADSNLLRYNIYSDGCPTENNVGPHSGTVIGTQTSTAESKHLLGQPKNTDLLAAVLRTKVHQFRYRDGRWNGETFTGIVTDESPWFGMDRDAAHPAGKALNDINGLGYTVGAIKALHAELVALRALHERNAAGTAAPIRVQHLYQPVDDTRRSLDLLSAVKLWHFRYADGRSDELMLGPNFHDVAWDFVTKDRRSLNETSAVGHVIGAVQELKARNDDLERRLVALEGRRR